MSTLPTSSFPYSSSKPVAVPASSTYAVVTDEANITTYPPEDDKMEYTYASYGEDPSGHIFKLFPDKPDSWTLSLSIPTPTKLSKPVLRSITYIIKYATTEENGNSTVQADVVLTTTTCPIGILSKSTGLGVYRNGPGYGPRMVDSTKALCLSSAPAIKCNGGNFQWSHYIDHRRLLPNVQVVDSVNLYLNFHVFEYPSTRTRRYLAIEVSATWCDISEVPGDSPDDETTEDSGLVEVATLAASRTEKNVFAPHTVPSTVSAPPSTLGAVSPTFRAASPTLSSPRPIINVNLRAESPTLSSPCPIFNASPPTVSAAPEVADLVLQDFTEPETAEIYLDMEEYPTVSSPHPIINASPPTVSDAPEVADLVIQDFIGAETEEIHLEHSEYPSVSSPRPITNASPPTVSDAPGVADLVLQDFTEPETEEIYLDTEEYPTVSSLRPTINASPPTVSDAPEVADLVMQGFIEAKIKEFHLDPCPNGFGWVKTATGYSCEGGMHHMTFAQLGLKP